MKNRLALLCAMGALQVTSGCVYTQVKTKDNATLTRVSLFGDQQASEVDLNGGRLKGYSSQQVEAAAAVAEGVARGIATAAK